MIIIKQGHLLVTVSPCLRTHYSFVRIEGNFFKAEICSNFREYVRKCTKTVDVEMHSGPTWKSRKRNPIVI